MLIKEQVLFNKEECQSILKNIEKWDDTIISVRLDGQLTNEGGVMKSFKINWDDNNSWIKNRVINWVNSLDEVFYKMNHNKNLSAYYRRYTKGDYFVKHNDHLYNGDKRLYTIGIMIHKSEDLIGGDLKMYINNDIININFNIGNVYIFDSNTEHSVDLVELGERITLMFFIVESDIIKNIKYII
jgi:predicted 2-oxoglutarate/Fe(II)-dependent dioxygenase YbiX